MYAVIEDRGRQYQAESGKRLVLDRNDVAVGETIELPVLLIVDGEAVEIGAPVLAGKKAVCKVVDHGRGPKVVGGIYKRRKDNLRRFGHRSDQTTVEVVSIG